MSRLKKFSILLTAALIIVCTICPVKSYAAVSNTDDEYTKITIAKEGYVTVTGKVNPSQFLNAKKESVNGKNIKKDGRDVVKIYPVSKGTYYVDKTASYKFTAIQQPANYCKAKAITANQGKTVTVYQTPDYHFNRWYKIKTTKKQSISIAKDITVDFYLYDSRGKQINFTQKKNGKDYISVTESLPKGTYYVYIEANTAYSSFDNPSRIITFSWK